MNATSRCCATHGIKHATHSPEARLLAEVEWGREEEAEWDREETLEVDATLALLLLRSTGTLESKLSEPSAS